MSIRSCHTIVHVLLLIHLSLFSFTQTQKLRFELLGGGLDVTSNYITKVLHDSKGYMWIASANGLIKYDGYTMSTFKYEAFNSNSLSQNMVYNMFINKGDSIWMGTPEGLAVFDIKTEKTERYNYDSVKKIPALGNVSAIAKDQDGLMWIGNYIGNLWTYDISKNQFSQSLFDSVFKSGYQGVDFHNGIMEIIVTRKGKILVVSNTGLYVISRKKYNPDEYDIVSFRHNPDDKNSLSSSDVFSIIEDSDGLIWATTGYGLNRIDLENGTVKRFLNDPADPGSLPSNYFHYAGNNIIEDGDRNIWIATTAGLVRYNRITGKFDDLTHLDNPGYKGNPNSALYVLGVDAGKNPFIVSPTGIFTANLRQQPLGLLKKSGVGGVSLSSSEVISVTEDQQGFIWIGTFGGGLNRWNRKTGEMQNFSRNRSSRSLRVDTVYAVICDLTGNVWVGNGSWLSLFNKKTEDFEHINTNLRNLESIDARNIYSLTVDRDGVIWMGTGNGIKSYNPVTKKPEHFFYDEAEADSTGISDYTALSVFADSRDNIWVGTGSISYNRFDIKKKKFTHFKSDPTDSTTVSSNLILTTFEDSKGRIWIGTFGGGLCSYDYSTGKFQTIGIHHGFKAANVYSIQEDKRGNLWLGTEKGLICFSPATNTFTEYDEKEGTQSNLFAAGYRNKGSSAIGSDGMLYFGGIGGLNYFYPDQIKPNTYLPPIVINSFKIFDSSVAGIQDLQEIILSHKQNYLSFEFAALNFTNPSKNEYAYRLSGVDTGWIYSGNRRYTSYTNLDPGTYTFRVKGSNNDGVWNEKGTTLRIVIRPPWWRTTAAYIFYGLLVIAAIVFIDRYQRKRLVAREKEKSRAKELAQAKEIEKAYHELKTTQAQLIQSEKMASLGELTAGIAHEIQNPLNFVNNFSEVNTELLQEMKAAIASGNISDLNVIATDLESNLEKINQHGKRADGIVKSMMLHSRQGSMQKEPTDINNLADEYLRLSYHGHRAKDKTFNATIKTNFSETIGKVPVIPQELGRVLLNIYNNAFYAVNEKKLKQPEGYEPTIELITTKTNGQLELKIRDNGNGIPSKLRDKIFQPFFTTKPTGQGTGLGLSMSYDIIKMHQGELTMKTEEGVGTEFIISLPVD